MLFGQVIGVVVFVAIDATEALEISAYVAVGAEVPLALVLSAEDGAERVVVIEELGGAPPGVGDVANHALGG